MSAAGDLLHQGATLGDLIVRATQRFAEREALVAEDKRWTYAELADRVARMGAVLRRRGLKSGDALAILSHNKADVLVVYLAAHGRRLAVDAAGSVVVDGRSDLHPERRRDRRAGDRFQRSRHTQRR